MRNFFMIPGSLPSLNEYIESERSNRFAAAKMKKDSTELCSHYARGLDIVKDKQYDVEICWYTVNAKIDSDNVNFGIKFILDGVVKAGKLDGDSYKYIRNISHKRVIDKTNARIEVTFIPVGHND